jgi:hypothetical protein
MRARVLLIGILAACAKGGGGSAVPPTPLQVVVTGSGQVTSEDGQECAGTCTFQIEGGTTLHASPGPSARFTGWTGLCSGTDDDCFVMAPFAGPAVVGFETVDCDVSGAKGAPTNFKASAGIRAANLSWTPPVGFDGCPSLVFEIDVQSVTSRVVTTSAAAVSIEGFTDAGTACFSLLATTRVARSDSLRLCVDFPQPPVPPESAVAFPFAGGAMIEWTLPLFATLINSPLSLVFPRIAWAVRAPDGRVFDAPPDAVSFFVPAIAAGSTGTFSVAGVSDVGSTLFPRQSNPVTTQSSVWRFAGFMPEARDSYGMIAAGGFLYLLGGAEGAQRPPVRVANIQADGSLQFQALAADPPLVVAGVAFVARDSATTVAISAGGLASDGSVSARVAAAELTAGSVSAWQELPPLPAPRVDAGIVAGFGSMFVLGGQSDDGFAADSFFARLAVDGTVATCAPVPCDSWVKGPDLPTPRIQAAAAIIGSRIYLVGGLGLRGQLDEVLVADLDASGFASGWRTTTAMPHVVDLASAAVVAGRLYVLGGDESDVVLIGQVDQATGDIVGWTENADAALLGSRASIGVAASDNRLFVCGGIGPAGAVWLDCQTAVVDPATGAFTLSAAP